MVAAGSGGGGGGGGGGSGGGGDRGGLSQAASDGREQAHRWDAEYGDKCAENYYAITTILFSNTMFVGPWCATRIDMQS